MLVTAFHTSAPPPESSDGVLAMSRTGVSASTATTRAMRLGKPHLTHLRAVERVGEGEHLLAFLLVDLGIGCGAQRAHVVTARHREVPQAAEIALGLLERLRLGQMRVEPKTPQIVRHDRHAVLERDRRVDARARARERAAVRRPGMHPADLRERRHDRGILLGARRRRGARLRLPARNRGGDAQREGEG